ncbi:MAG: helix-turn-helix transcriptional regulator [Selenomonas sp.]|nr:helix-turn-helix transcriptional regulator [Selenomonas sp.]
MENNLGNKEIMAKNITRYMQAKGVNRADFCRDLGFNYNTVSDWIHARKYPRIDKIEAMARYFGITKADLVEPAPPPSPASSQPYHPELTEHEREHIELYRELDERGRNAVDDLTDLHVERVRESTERSSGSTGTENAAEKRA